jgi:hypothetical protein
MKIPTYIFLLSMIVAPALADPSTASHAAGGIAFTKTTAVRMKSEDLFISFGEIRARFEFINDTGKNLDTAVAFPLPELKFPDAGYADFNFPGNEEVNFVGFKVAVNGKAITPALERRALLNGRDIAAEIAAAGLHVNPLWEPLELETLASATGKKLVAAGILGMKKKPAMQIPTRRSTIPNGPCGRSIIGDRSFRRIKPSS